MNENKVIKNLKSGECGVAPQLGFLTKKDAEMKDIRLIAKLKKEGVEHRTQ